MTVRSAVARVDWGEFLEASFWHGSVEQAEAMLKAHSAVARANIYCAAALGDDEAVGDFLAMDRSLATAKGGPRNLDALTYLCFSRFLAQGRSRSNGFLRAATALLDAGANPNTGFFDATHTPHPTHESALYGAAGVAFHPGITRLLLERGANPNDDEVPYHAPEARDNRALRALLDSGTLTQDSLAVMLLRKSDLHDYDGIKLVLDAGADVNRMSRSGRPALHHAILCDNSLKIIVRLLARGADPNVVAKCLDHAGSPRRGRSAISLAARRGRGDVLHAMETRGIPLLVEEVDQVVANCARGRSDDTPTSAVLERMRRDAGALLCEFAGNNNAGGVALLLDFGFPVDAPYEHEDGYFDVTPRTTALLNAAWRAAHDTVELLVERGADVNAFDGKGRTPLVQAIRAATESRWQNIRSPRSVRALLDAGASRAGVRYPTGYHAIDDLIARTG